ncbi:hypothetical protein MVEN_01389300 [Mycena venus]|uniref:DUF6535 domain-containing protein n=1 Tax=Mycena venus TaxID=2733690 RepID=A0A8H6XV10_9AGAR|nr:hypothetical protein MVEN_01389300 [Mycena venus]
MLFDENPGGQPPADTDRYANPSTRLINTLEKCFSDLMRKQEEQSDKFHEALEALKPKPPATNTKTAFWNAYKALADEHDKEFQQKYSTDLDTALIFAGLFSANPLLVLVAQNILYVSLFSTLLAALLAESAGPSSDGLERQRKFDGLCRWKFDAVMQTFPLLLQIGLFLFSAALSIYLWTVHLSLAIISLAFTSFGFISYTGLLISAIAALDSPFQTPLAPLVMRLVPTMLLLEARRLASRVMIPVCGMVQRCYSVLQSICGAQNLLPFHERRTSGASINLKSSEPAVLFDMPIPQPSPAVPAVCWLLETSTDPRMIAIAAEMIIDLQWPCDDMDVRPLLNKLRDGILTCFRFSPDPSGGSFMLTHIRDGMSTHAIYLGRAYCTLRCLLLLGSQRAKAREYWCFDTILLFIKDPELENVLRILDGSLDLHFESHRATKWGLNVLPSHRYFDRANPALNRLALDRFLEQFSSAIPALDKISFADYLFCLLVFLSCASSRGAACVDKRCGTMHYQTKANRFSSLFQGKLFEHLFQALESNIAARQISMATAAKILEITGQLAVNAERSVWDYKFHHLRQSLPYRFCSSLPRWDGWIGVVLATGRLTARHNYGHRSPNREHVSNLQDGVWVYIALTGISETALGEEPWDSLTANGVAGLLAALMFYRLPAEKEHIHILLRALTIPGDVSENAAALLVEDHVITWFQDEELDPILEAASVWSSLMHVALEVDKPGLTRSCIHMARTLAEIPHWKSEIQEELCALITIFFRMGYGGRKVAGSYNLIVSEFCQTRPSYDFVDSDERTLGLSYQVLCDVWRDFDFTASGSMLKSVVLWLRCTNVVLMCTYFFVCDDGEFLSEDYMEITSEFKTAFSVPLRDALLEAATAAENMPAGSGLLDSRNGKEVVGKITEILQDMASKTPKHTDPRKADKLHWESVRKQLDEDIYILETMVDRLATDNT